MSDVHPIWTMIAFLPRTRGDGRATQHRKGKEKLTFSITWQWSLMKKIVPLSGRLICMPIRPSVWPGKWCRVMPWQKSKLRSSKVFQFLREG